MKRTFQPSCLVRKRRHGFRARMATKNGRLILSRRRAIGRARLSAQFSKLKNLISLKKRSDFLDLRGKEIFFSKYFILQFHPTNNQDDLLFGLVASKKIGCAVKRNKAKRRMREMFRTIATPQIPGGRVVMIARYKLVDACYEDVLNDLKKNFPK